MPQTISEVAHELALNVEDLNDLLLEQAMYLSAVQEQQARHQALYLSAVHDQQSWQQGGAQAGDRVREAGG